MGGHPLTRIGVGIISQKQLRRAAQKHPSLKDKWLYPRNLRHTTAVRRLQSKGDLSTIANWLGHVRVNLAINI